MPSRPFTARDLPRLARDLDLEPAPEGSADRKWARRAVLAHAHHFAEIGYTPAQWLEVARSEAGLLLELDRLSDTDLEHIMGVCFGA